MHTEDAELVRRCREGDRQAYEAIYRRHHRSLYNVAYRMVGHLSDAEDLLQEIFLLAFDRIGSFEGRSSLGTWLHRLAVNRCLDHLKSRAGRNRALTDSLEENEPADAFDAAAARLERMDLERAIGQLPQSYRAAFVLYDVQGFDHREVAEILGVAEGTSKSLVHKARLKLRRLIGGTAEAGRP